MRLESRGRGDESRVNIGLCAVSDCDRQTNKRTDRSTAQPVPKWRSSTPKLSAQKLTSTSF